MKQPFIKPPFLSTSFSEDGKRLKRRFANILCAGGKRAGVLAVAFALTLTLAAGAMVACNRDAADEAAPNDGQSNVQTEGTAGAYDLALTADEALAAALLAERDKYAETEFWAEGHILMDMYATSFDAKTGSAQCMGHALTTVGGYSFINGMFVKESGTGVIPALVMMSQTNDGYVVDEIRYPEDGSHYAESIEAMFPEELREQAYNADDYYDELLAQERAQAEEYLKSIGREADIGEYSDLDIRLPDISAEASNKLSDMKKEPEFNRYPDFIGTHEYVEDGERFIYETQYDPDTKTVIWTRVDSGGSLAARHAFEVSGGDVKKVE